MNSHTTDGHDEAEAERIRAELRMRCGVWFSEAEKFRYGHGETENQ